METEVLHTSGSTGKPKEITVDRSRMMESARMTCDFLGLRSGDTALLCLNTKYIAGRMMEIRAEERALRLIRRPPSSHPLHDVSERIDFAAMVPLQVFETLRVPLERERFSNIGNVIIGGGTIDWELEKELKTFRNNIWSTYGMTETLSHIAMRRIAPGGGESCYRPLPGVNLSQDNRGCLIIDAPHLNPETVHTNDIVEFVHGNDNNIALNNEGVHSDVRFIVKGRIDNVICSGGIKIQIEEVESLLRPYFGDTIMVTSKPNRKFGEVVVFLTTKPIDEHALRLILPPYWLPKQIVQVPRLPRTETGKPNRAKAKAILEAGTI